MRSSREAIKSARSLFRACFSDGVLDPVRVRAVVDAIGENKPRGYIAILQVLNRLVRLELDRRHAVIESAAPLSEPELKEIHADLIRTHGRDLTFATEVRPDLIGGLRIRVGSDVWDGSIKSRLATIPA